MEIHIILFMGFIFGAIFMAIFGFIRQPQIPALLTFAGMFIFAMAIITDTIIIDDRIDFIVATENTFNITTSTITIPEYSYSVITGTNILTIRADGSNVHTYAELITTDSVLKGQLVQCVNLPLIKVGSPTGLADIGVFDENNAPIFIFGQISVASIDTNFAYYEFCDNNGGYTLAENDKIGIRWVIFNVSDASNFIRTVADTSDPFDGANTIRTQYSTSWGTTSTQDMNAQYYVYNEHPNNVQVAGIGGIYTYEDNTIQFTEMPKVLFGLFGVIMMLSGALMVVRNP